MLNRLKRPFYWQNFAGYEDRTDDAGVLAVTFPTYSETFSARANVSANKGSAEAEMFGNLLEYDRVIVTRQTDIDMNETSIIWLDGAKPPDPYNYIVARKAVSNNIAVFALKRVEVGNEDNG